MKKTVKLGIAILSLITFTNIAHAAIPGGYVGFGLGGSRIESSNEDLLTGDNLRNTRTRGGLGGRAFGGFNFNRYFGIEAGYARYAPSKYTTSSTVDSSYATLKDTMTAFDLVGKAYLPIQDSGFNLYALAGAARVNGEQKLTWGNSSMTVTETETAHKTRPIYGIGASYEVSEHVTTNLEFTHIQGTGKTSSTPSANMLTMNIAYNFG
jgi:opacity protein-like surface antigen